MGKIAFLFAGQGAQAPGMGQSLYQQGGAAARVFNEMEAVRPGTLEDCFTADAQRLMQTAVTQPCVYTVDLACAEALRQAGIVPEAAAGFSLGEVAALTFAGVFTPADGAEIVCRRGEIMQRANEKYPGAMAAVLRMADEDVETLCRQHTGVWPVNYNCPGQLVVAGLAEALPAFCDAVKAAGGMPRPLPVGGAFHTPLMQEAAVEFSAVLQAENWQPPAMPVVANLTAAPYQPPYADTLAAQMHNPVRWRAAVEAMVRDGFDTFVEVGPGKTLSGFVRRIAPEAAIYHVNDAETLAQTLDELAKQHG